MKANGPLISVIINNYNNEYFIAECIQSVQRQTWPSIELIVVDDGSTDCSVDVIVRSLGNGRLIRKENNGQGSCYNVGFEASTGDWIMFLDADDVLLDDGITRLLNAVDNSSSAVCGVLQCFGVNYRSQRTIVPDWRRKRPVTKDELLTFGSYVSPPGSGFLYRRSYLETVLPLDEARWQICADTVPIVLAPLHGQVALCLEVIGRYRRHRMAATNVGADGQIISGVRLQFRRCLQRRGFVYEILKVNGLAFEGLLTPAEVKLWAILRNQHDKYADEVSRDVAWRSFRAISRWQYYTVKQRFLSMLAIMLLYALPRQASVRFAAYIIKVR